MRILSALLSSLFSWLCVLFSWRGRVTRAELLFGTFAWAIAILVAMYAALLAKTLGHGWAPNAWVGFLLVALASIQNMAVQRVHDAGYSYWSGFRRFRMFRRGMAEANAYGPPPPRGRVWGFLAFLVLLLTAGITGASLVTERYATVLCAPTVSVSAATGAEAQMRWREAVRSKHGAVYLTGNTVRHSMTCRDGTCTVSGRACRLP
ncbi:MAG TPA: DUF805 domain-containing protein [Xanthobacteraceae bacterium]|nr:DUF805 domain-containing protein [Xanthobacteraceae bacterium]